MTAISRRGALGLIGTGAALSAASSLAIAPARAEEEPLGRLMYDRAARFLDMLDEKLHQAAVFGFDDRQRRAWNYMTGSRPAPGVRLEQMTSQQKDAALDLLAAGLGSGGLETAMNIMLQQDILRDEWKKGSADRSRERFSLMIFGKPSMTGSWGWRWEGHHLTITFTLKDGRVVSHTPKAFSSEPNTVPSGPHEGLVVLPENETLGRALFAGLGATARKAALVSEKSYGNVRALAGRESVFSAPEGVAIGDMDEGSAEKARRLIELYTSDHLADALSQDQKERIAKQDMASARFAWAGPNREGQSLYYRLHGETFLIEFATLFNQPLHHHTVVHDLERNLGRHVL